MESPVTSEAGDSLCSSVWQSQLLEDTEKESRDEDGLEEFGEDENIEEDVSVGTESPGDASMLAVEELNDKHEEAQNIQEHSGGASELRQDVCHERNDANRSVSPERHTPVRVYSNDIDEAPLTVVDDENQNNVFGIDIHECDKCHEKGSFSDDDSNVCPGLEVKNGHQSGQECAMKSCSEFSDSNDIGSCLDESIKQLNLETNLLEANEGGELENFKQENKKNKSPNMELPVCRRNTDSLISEDLEHSKENSHVSKQNIEQIEQHVDSIGSLHEPCNKMEPRSNNPIVTVPSNLDTSIENSSTPGSYLSFNREENAELQLPQEDCCEKESHQVDKLVDHNKHPLKRPFIAKMGSFIVKSNFSFEQIFAPCAPQSLPKPCLGRFGHLGKVSSPDAPPRSQNTSKAAENKPTKSVGSPHHPKLPKGEKCFSSEWSNIKQKYLRSSGLHSKRVETLLMKYLGPEGYKSKRTSQSSPESMHLSP